MDVEEHLIPSLVCIVMGATTLMLRFCRVKWFMNHYKVRNLDDALGNKLADITYLLIGVLCIAFGFLLASGIL